MGQGSSFQVTFFPLLVLKGWHEKSCSSPHFPFWWPPRTAAGAHKQRAFGTRQSSMLGRFPCENLKALDEGAKGFGHLPTCLVVSREWPEPLVCHTGVVAPLRSGSAALLIGWMVRTEIKHNGLNLINMYRISSTFKTLDRVQTRPLPWGVYGKPGEKHHQRSATEA